MEKEQDTVTHRHVGQELEKQRKQGHMCDLGYPFPRLIHDHEVQTDALEEDMTKSVLLGRPWGGEGRQMELRPLVTSPEDMPYTWGCGTDATG